jgi:hypothetical protein
LRRAGLRLAVSRRTIVTHRYEDTFEFACGQWRADGQGLARMIRKYGWEAALLLGLPLSGSVRGVLLSLVRLQPGWIPYYLCYMVFNYVAMIGELGKGWTTRSQTAPQQL